MTNSLIKTIIAAGAVFLLAACNDPSSPLATENQNQADTIITKVRLDDASYEEISPYVAPCQGNKLCVLICHRPPGNPSKSHTKNLPLAATKGHLGHGDHLGACMGDGEESGEGNTEDGDEDEDGSSGSPPTWCEYYYDIDQDCDGFDDNTGEPLF